MSYARDRVTRELFEGHQHKQLTPAKEATEGEFDSVKWGKLGECASWEELDEKTRAEFKNQRRLAKYFVKIDSDDLATLYLDNQCFDEHGKKIIIRLVKSFIPGYNLHLERLAEQLNFLNQNSMAYREEFNYRTGKMERFIVQKSRRET